MVVSFENTAYGYVKLFCYLTTIGCLTESIRLTPANTTLVAANPYIVLPQSIIFIIFLPCGSLSYFIFIVAKCEFRVYNSLYLLVKTVG
jgi:hypothetical protein